MSVQLIILIIGILWFLLTYILLFYFFSSTLERESMNGAIKKNLRREEIIIKENVKLNSVEAVDVPKSYIYANFSYHNIPRVKIV